MHRLVLDRKKKAEELRGTGIEPYPHAFSRTDRAVTILAKHRGLKPEKKTTEKVTIAGRIILFRNMGKLAFGQLRDGSGQIQVMLSKQVLEKEWPVVKKLDIGDFLGVTGTVVATKTGEITVSAQGVTLLAKALRPLPDKHHGLQDVEMRYRKRYLDLIANPDVKERFVQRAAIIKAMRDYLDTHGLLEVETPTLQPIYGGASAKPFMTHHNALGLKLYLRISDELFLKRLLVGGFDGVYEICKVFRNEGVDTKHNPEFTMLEWYLAYADYHDGMRMTEEMVAGAAQRLHGTTKIIYQGAEIDLTPPWRRVTMVDLIKEHAKIDVLDKTEEELRAFCEKEKVEQKAYDTWGLLVQAIFEHFCEAKLVQPTFVIDHPVETTPLCKTHRSGDKRFVERFEFFIIGMEFGNAYTELNDPAVQKRHFQEQQDRKRLGDEETHPMDEEFVEALEYGMPPTSGVGIGVDRVVMLLTDGASIRDVILFPTMRPQE